MAFAYQFPGNILEPIRWQRAFKPIAGNTRSTLWPVNFTALSSPFPGCPMVKKNLMAGTFDTRWTTTIFSSLNWPLAPSSDPSYTQLPHLPFKICPLYISTYSPPRSNPSYPFMLHDNISSPLLLYLLAGLIVNIVPFLVDILLWITGHTINV